MRKVPDCMHRRYRALDELIKDLTSVKSNDSSGVDCGSECSNDAGIKLMCDFWDILKEDPDCNLTQAVQQRMGVKNYSNGLFRPQRVTCYMAGNTTNDNKEENKKDVLDELKNICCQSGSESEAKSKCCASKSVSPSIGSDVLPLNKVLCNLKEAASFDKKCNARLYELMETQKELQNQIQHLEHREKEGVQLLKQADCMWSCMEDAYKKKIAQSSERQKTLLKQLKEVEASTAKWRKNKKEIELQMSHVDKCQQEMTEKINQKTNDMKSMDAEIADFKKRIENNKAQIEAAKKSLGTKKQVSNVKMASIATELSRLEKLVSDEHRNKLMKEQDGNNYVKEAREDLRKICKVLLQKKLENEDLRAEKEALLLEIDLLTKTCDQCKDKCKNKTQAIIDEIKKIDKEIVEFKVRCIQCHECTDTSDVRKFCTDCPKCVEERNCLYKDDHCNPDHTMDCVCMSVKQKFLDNVFDNMYTVLERQSKTGPGKVVAEMVMDCLKKSRNGKLNEETRKIVQNFILSTVKKYLNLTIVGGAVKTRCEMDPETYKQLMVCLKQVTVTRPPKADKGTVAKKEACRRWGGTSECNCPGGPKACVCTKKAPPPPHEPLPCPSPPKDNENEDAADVIICPHKESVSCGPDCAMHAVPSRVGTDVAEWRPNPCEEQTCPFPKNMRAAQCMLGPESLSTLSIPKGIVSTIPYIPDLAVLDDMITCKCSSTSTKPCTCHADSKQVKVEIIKQCDKDTCSSVWKQSNDDINLKNRRSPIEQEIREETYIQKIPIEENKGKNKGKYYLSTQADILKKEETHVLTEKVNESESIILKPSFTFENIKSGILKDIFKVAIKNETGSTDEYYTEIVKTSSGILTMALDQNMIEMIEDRSCKDPNSFVLLNRTLSGHFLLDFSPSDTITDDKKRIVLKKTSSGNTFIEIHKKIFNTPDVINDKKIENQFTSQTSIPVEITTNIDKHEDDPKQNFKKYKKELEEFLVENKEKIYIKIQCLNGTSINMQAVVTKTSSGNIAVDLKNILSLGDIIFNKSKERPVLLTKSHSNDYILKFTQGDNKAPNAVLRRTSSGGILVVITEPVLQSMETVIENVPTPTHDFFKVKVKGASSDFAEPSAVLKATQSGNYIIILDKEFEKRYTQTIQEYVGDQSECYVKLEKTNSGNYIINFEDSFCHNIQNALLIKSVSGNMKVLVNGPVFKSMEQIVDIKESSKAFGELVNELSRSSKELHKKNLKRGRIMNVKCSSDSCLLEKVKIELKDQQGLIAEPSAVLKKTISDQYVIVLTKQCKKQIIKRLKTNLTNSSQGIIPIKKTESGEIVIIFGNDAEEQYRYDSLRISPSGNIYLLVDKYFIEGIRRDFVQKPVKENKAADSESCHIIGSNQNPADKAVTTTCNANPDKDSCEVTKCLCKELHNKSDDLLLDRLEKKMNFNPIRSQYCDIDWSKVKRNILVDGTHRVCDSSKCSEKCCSHSNRDNNYYCKEKSPHIIKPCDCNLEFEKQSSFGSNEQCYFVIDSVCHIHKDRYNCVSNELLEISGLCNKADEIDKNEITQVNNNETSLLTEELQDKVIDWDSLSFLPPQLPPFLRNLNYNNPKNIKT